MQVQVDIKFDQLVQIAKKLPSKQWVQLKKEVEIETSIDKTTRDFKTLLLNGPTFSKEQIDAIKETRKAVNRWRTK